MRAVFCLVFPRLSADRVLRGECSEALRREPLALVEIDGSTQRVAAVSELAVRAGAREGMTLAEARAIAPRLRALPHRPDEDARALRSLATMLGRFSPIVGLVGPDAIALDVTGCERLFGGRRALAEAAIRAARDLGYGARFALAGSAPAARALARVAPPAGTLVEPGRDAAALAALPPILLGIDADAAARLSALGVATIAQLDRLPRAALPARVGGAVLEALDRALGRAGDPIEAYRPQALPAQRIDFPAPIDRPDALAFALKRLADGVAAELEGRFEGARALRCVVERPDAPAERFDLSLSEPRRAASWLLTLLRARFERVDLGAGVAAVELRVLDAEPLPAGEPTLFEERVRGAREDLRALLDRLVARLGADSLGVVALNEDYRPERAYAFTSSAVMSERRKKTKSTKKKEENEEKTIGDLPPRPLRLLATPDPIDLERSPSGEPVRLRRPGERWREVARAAGPERIEAGWWDGAPAAREHWVVEERGGARRWIGIEGVMGRAGIYGEFL